jgi:hypothetical protein
MTQLTAMRGLTMLVACALLGAACSTVPPGPRTGGTAAPNRESRPPVGTTASAAVGFEAGTVTVDPIEMDARYEAALPLFDYDQSMPLELTPSRTETVDGATAQSITYASSQGETVPAVVVSPGAPNGLPGIVMLFPGRGTDFLDRAAAFARLGAAVLAIDPPQVRRGGELTRFIPADRDEQIELIIELRRGVDVLEEVGADPDRLAFWGYSWGCAMGAQLAGIERRIGSYVLMFCEGGMVEHFTGPDDAEGPLADMPPEERDEWTAAMEPIEPLYFVRHAAPSALLIQNALHDESIRAEDAERLHEHASQPKEIRWYDSGHEDAPAEAWCDQAMWLHSRLDLASADLAECPA